jgi:hypothetical protein
MTGSLRTGVRVWLAALCCGFGAGEAASQPAAGVDESVVRLSTDIFGGWDKSLTPDRGLVTAPERDDLTYGGINLSLMYDKRFENVSFTTTGNASTRYSPQIEGDIPGVYAASVTLTSAGPTKWTWMVSQRLNYGRQNAVTLFPGRSLDAGSLEFGLPDSPVDAQLTDLSQLSSTSLATVGFGLSRRDRLQFGVHANALFTEGTDQRYLRAGGLVGYTRQLSRYSSLRAGYNHSENIRIRDADAVRDSTRIGTIDLGLDYARPLPFSRETTVAFNTGIAGTPGTGGWRYTAVGSARVSRSFARSWVAVLGGERSVRFVPTFIEPTLTNAVSATLAGRLSRNLSASFAGNYSVGQAGFAPGRTKFDAYTATARTRYAIFRRVGIYTEYFYFLASIRGNGADGLPQGERSRHGVRLGLSFGTELVDGRR